MGKSFRQRSKKRKQERAKHSNKRSLSSSVRAENKKKKIKPSSSSSHHNGVVVSQDSLLRSPVLSKYLDPALNVLVVGDGDFSFGRALCELRSKYMIMSTSTAATDIVTGGGSLTITGYDSRQEVLNKYNDKSLRTIEQSIANSKDANNARVLHSVDATKLHQRSEFNADFDIVVFNFPHSGQQRVHINRYLMYEFFQSVHSLFQQSTDDVQRKKRRKPRRRQVHVTIKNQRPYNCWEIESSAQQAGFVLNPNTRHKIPFDMKLWNQFGYLHQTTVGPKEATSQPQLQAQEKEAKLAETWIFEFEQDTTTTTTASSSSASVIGTQLTSSFTKQPTTRTTIATTKATNDTTNEENNDNYYVKKLREAPKDIDDEEIIRIGNDDKNNKEVGEKNNKEIINNLVQQRDIARKEKNWKEADRIRDLLCHQYGVSLLDNKDKGTSWIWTPTNQTNKTTTEEQPSSKKEKKQKRRNKK